MTTEQIAELRTEMVDKELDLNDKQRKKVYRLYLLRTLNEMEANGDGRMMPPGGDGQTDGGMRGDGAMMVGVMRSDGRMGGNGQMRPEQMGGMRDRQGMPPEGGMAEVRRPDGAHQAMVAGGGWFGNESEKDIAAVEKKMKKILTAEQFERWRQVESDRRRDGLLRPARRDVR